MMMMMMIHGEKIKQKMATPSFSNSTHISFLKKLAISAFGV